jgi:hypothetical protein
LGCINAGKTARHFAFSAGVPGPHGGKKGSRLRLKFVGHTG